MFATGLKAFQMPSTTQMSQCCSSVGIALGLNPRKSSGISGCKGVETAVTNHKEATAMNAAACMGHAQLSVPTLGYYADAKRRCNDTTAFIRNQPVRDLPGSVEAAHDCNFPANVAAGVQAGRIARQDKYQAYLPADVYKYFQAASYEGPSSAGRVRQPKHDHSMPKHNLQAHKTIIYTKYNVLFSLHVAAQACTQILLSNTPKPPTTAS